jgi:hypothetical protein
MHGSSLQAGSQAEIEPWLPDARFRLLDTLNAELVSVIFRFIGTFNFDADIVGLLFA